MKKLNKDEIPEVLPVTHGRNTHLRTMLLQLSVGEVLEMPITEWKTKHGPYYIVSYIKKSHGFRYEYGKKTDGTSWLFKRLA